MKAAILTCLLMAGVSSAAYAKDATDGKSGSFAVEKMICSKVAYQPAVGQKSPSYQAGVDVNGQAVAPADLSGGVSSAMAPDFVEVPMTVDLASKMGLSSQLTPEGKLPVANLKLFKDGRVEYNGQDISSNAADLCGVAQKGEGPKPVQSIEPAAGQDKMLVAPSVTTNPDPKESYVADRVAPQEFEPQAGSVAASTTTSPPKVKYKIQQGTANRSPYPVAVQ